MLFEEHLEPVDSDWMQPEAPPTNAKLLLVDNEKQFILETLR